jgi:hypothetical protein
LNIERPELYQTEGVIPNGIGCREQSKESYLEFGIGNSNTQVTKRKIIRKKIEIRQRVREGEMDW